MEIRTFHKEFHISGFFLNIGNFDNPRPGTSTIGYTGLGLEPGEAALRDRAALLLTQAGALWVRGLPPAPLLRACPSTKASLATFDRE